MFAFRHLSWGTDRVLTGGDVSLTPKDSGSKQTERDLYVDVE